MTSSFTPPPPASRKTIRMPDAYEKPPVYKVFLAAFIGVFLISILGDSHTIQVQVAVLFLTGSALLINPPKYGLGKLADFSAIALITCLFLTFLPLSSWLVADWRLNAQASGIELPLTLSFQPFISFEIGLISLASLLWIYAALQWPINLPGRSWLFFWLSLLLTCIVSVLVLGSLCNLGQSETAWAQAFNFFASFEHRVNLLTLSGVASFAYALQGIGMRALRPLSGVPATFLCFVALYQEGALTGIIFYFIGIFLCYLICVRFQAIPRAVTIVFPLLVVALMFVVLNNDEPYEEGSGSDFDTRFTVYEDSLEMLVDAPLSGVGFGNFFALLPQYQESLLSEKHEVYPESDILWIAAEGGIFTICAIVVFIVAYARCCRGIDEGKTAIFRLSSLTIVLIFLLLSLLDTPGHRPAVAYFSILFAVLALPRRARKPISVPPFFWRFLGVCFLFFSLFWSIAGVFKLPWHSSTRPVVLEKKMHTHIDIADYDKARNFVEKWISARPLDWRGYSHRARLVLLDSGNLEDAAADFERARIVEPLFEEVTFQEGNAFLPYDIERAISAWNFMLTLRSDHSNPYFMKILERVKNSPEQMEATARLLDLDLNYRAQLLTFIDGYELMRELDIELAEDPSLSAYTVEQRTKIISHWLKNGDKITAAKFINENEEFLNNVWWLQSLICSLNNDFKEAVEVIRANLKSPEASKDQFDEVSMVRLRRDYLAAPDDVEVAYLFVYACTTKGDYDYALKIIGRISESGALPPRLQYWRAECLYQLKDYIQSWLAYKTYIEEFLLK